MPVFIECSSCHRKLRVRNELVGRSVRCPNCKTKFLAAQVEELSAPSGEGGPPTAVGSSTAESHEAVLPPAAPVAAKEDSSGPTLRRPMEASPPATMPTAAPVLPPEAITVRPPAPAERPGPPAVAPPGGAGVSETPWAKVSLVLGLILLGVVLIGLLGAWWVSAGMSAARRGAPGRVGVRLVATSGPLVSLGPVASRSPTAPRDWQLG
jgi:hypothetical protein